MATINNIENNEVVNSKSKSINIEAIINVDNNASDYIVLMYVGLWKKHKNHNHITISEIYDMGGQISYKETFVDIIKQK